MTRSALAGQKSRARTFNLIDARSVSQAHDRHNAVRETKALNGHQWSLWHCSGDMPSLPRVERATECTRLSVWQFATWHEPRGFAEPWKATVPSFRAKREPLLRH
jgi:hypothetical protein